MYALRSGMTYLAILAPAVEPYGLSIVLLAVSIMFLTAADEIRDARMKRTRS